MRVITWNVGFWLHRSKHDEAWTYLREQIKPDIALLQEVSPPLPLKDENLFFKQIHSGWGTALYTRGLPASELTIASKYSSRLASANIESSSKQKIMAISIHAPIINGRVFPHLSEIFDSVESKVRNHSFIVGGDLNTARLAEKVWPGYGHGPFFTRLSQSIFFDCHHKFHATEEQTYFRKNSKYPFQDDHLFVSQDIAERVKSCSILDNETIRNFSDHLPVIAEISI